MKTPVIMRSLPSWWYGVIIMFGWKKKKQQANASPSSVRTSVANGKNDGHAATKKSKGPGSLSHLSKLFGSQGDGINKKPAKKAAESPPNRPKPPLKSRKKTQAPPPPTKNPAPRISPSDEDSYETIQNVSTASSERTVRNNESQYHNGGVGNHTTEEPHYTTVMRSSESLPSLHSSAGSSVDGRREDHRKGEYLLLGSCEVIFFKCYIKGTNNMTWNIL